MVAVKEYENRYKVCLCVGVRGTYQGLTATILKQGSNQAIRFYVMNSLRNWYKGERVSPSSLEGFELVSYSILRLVATLYVGSVDPILSLRTATSLSLMQGF